MLPLGAVTAQLVQFMLMYTTVVALGALSGVMVPSALLAILPLVALQFIFTCGLALAFATAHVFFRDTRHLLEVMLQIWFWVTPVVYSLAIVPAGLRGYFLLNPMAWFVSSYHDIVLDGTAPSLAAFGLMAVVTCTIAFLGLTVFGRYERKFAELV